MTKIDTQLWKIPGLQTGFFMAQVYEFIIVNIQEGFLLPKTYLPSYREIAKLNGINRNTVLRVFNRLQEQGWIIAQPGKGSYISPTYPGHNPLDPVAEPITSLPVKLGTLPSSLVDLAPSPRQNFTTVGFDRPSPHYFPVTIYYKYMRYHIKRYEHVTQMQQVIDSKGMDFKDAILTHLNVMRGFNLIPDTMEVMMGRRESLDSLFSVLIRPGDIVINTSGQDLELNQSISGSGAKCHPMSTLDPDFISNLRSFLQYTKIKALHVRPQCSYPENNTLSTAVCKQLLDLAMEYGFYIIEEDEYHEFWYKLHPFIPLVCHPHKGHVIYLGVLSLLTPYMQNTRIIAAAAEFISLLKSVPVEPFRHRNIIEEKVIEDILRSGELWRYAKKARIAKDKHRYEITMGMENYLRGIATVNTPECGLSLWLCFESDEKLAAYMEEIEQSGLGIPYPPGSQMPGPGIKDMRLGYGTWQVREAEEPAKLIQARYISDMEG